MALALNGFANHLILPMKQRPNQNPPKNALQTSNAPAPSPEGQHRLAQSPIQSQQADRERQENDEGGDNSSGNAEEESSSELSSSPQTSHHVVSSSHPSQQAMREEFQVLGTRDLFDLILQHLIEHMPVSTRASRLQFLLLELRDGVALMELMNKFDKRDLALIAQHKKFIEILGANLGALLDRPEYAVLRTIDRQQLVLQAYSSLSLEISMGDLRKAISKEGAIRASGGTGSAFVGQLMEQTRRDFESKNIKFVSEEDQLIMRRIEGREAERLLASDPFADFGLQRDCQFDKVSKYGIFSSKEEEQSMCREGVFNYRLHRTMLLLERLGVMAPHQNLKLAKSLALFLIALTDCQIVKLLNQSVNIAKLTAKSASNNSFDEVAYFAPKPSTPEESGSLWRLKYPSLLQAYSNLRTVELIDEGRLFDNLLPEINERFSRGKKRLSKDEKAISEYFTRKPNPEESIAHLKSDTEREAAHRQGNRLAVQPRHVSHCLENHVFYRNHMMLWRFNVIY